MTQDLKDDGVKHLVALTVAEKELIHSLRVVIDEHIDKQNLAAMGRAMQHPIDTTIEMPRPERLRLAEAVAMCGEERDGKVCIKPLHKGKHTFRTRPHVAPLSKWQQIDTFQVWGSGSKVYTLRVGSPCKVLGFGKKTAVNPGGAAQSGWTVSKIEINRDASTQDINITVDRRGSHTRTVKADRIVYVRPKKG